MNKYLTGMLVLGMSTSLCFAADMPNAKLKVKGKLPTGVHIVKNKVTLKSGYQFEKTSSHSVNVIGRMSGGKTGITGNFDCTCNGTSGGCDVIVTGSSVSCAVSSCTSSCYMIVTIPGSSPGYIR